MKRLAVLALILRGRLGDQPVHLLLGDIDAVGGADRQRRDRRGDTVAAAPGQAARARAAGAGAARRRAGAGRGGAPRRTPGPLGVTVAGEVKNYVPVTDEMLRNPDPGDWLMVRRNYQGWSYSPLDADHAATTSRICSSRGSGR